LAPDGRYEHVPLRPAPINQTDLAAFCATAEQLSDVGGWGVIAEAVEAAVRYLPMKSGGELLNQAVRLCRLLSIQPATATGPAWDRLTSPSSCDTVLTHHEEIAYQRLVDEITAAWCPGDRLSRWLY
jgi:hypothetical protein